MKHKIRNNYALNTRQKIIKLGIDKSKAKSIKSIGRNAVRNIQTDDNANSGVDSVILVTKTSHRAVKISRTTYSGIKTAGRMHAYIKRRAQKVKHARAASLITRTASQVQTLKNSATLIRLAAMNPLIIGAACLVIMLLVLSSSSAGAAVPATCLIADETVVQKYTDKITQMDAAMQKRIENYQTEGAYDDVVIEWMGELGQVKTNWQEILSIIAVEFEQDVSFKDNEQKRLVELYNMLNYITTRTEHYYCSGCYCPGHGSDPEWYCSGCQCDGHIRLYVQVHSLDMEDIIDNIGFEDWQKEWVRTLAATDWSSLYPGIAELAQNELSTAEIAEIMKSTATSSVARNEIRNTALSLVGRVGYFWGGKSGSGWNNSWGSSVKVTAPGSSTTGTYQPYGLDCSGFTDWVYKTSGVGNILSGGSAYQWSQSYAITKDSLKVGDLVFKSRAGTSGTNHVGIFVGIDKNGNYLFCHCAYGQGVVVNSYKGFKYYRRPFVKFEE